MEVPKDTTDVKEFKGSAITPEVTWAQRSSASDADRNHIFLTIVVPDVNLKTSKLDIQPTKLTFTGYSETRKATYHVEIEFYEEIDPSSVKTNHTGRALEFVLPKKELSEKFWPRLLKNASKVHWLRTDFDKWVDEDEQDEVEEDDYMSRMGGMGGGMPGMGGMGGMPGMGGMGGDQGFGGIDFSKLGGMGGAAGLGEDGEEEDDEDLPEEEDEEAGAGASKSAEPASSGAKIEEVE